MNTYIPGSSAWLAGHTAVLHLPHPHSSGNPHPAQVCLHKGQQQIHTNTYFEDEKNRKLQQQLICAITT